MHSEILQVLAQRKNIHEQMVYEKFQSVTRKTEVEAMQEILIISCLCLRT